MRLAIHLDRNGVILEPDKNSYKFLTHNTNFTAEVTKTKRREIPKLEEKPNLEALDSLCRSPFYKGISYKAHSPAL